MPDTPGSGRSGMSCHGTFHIHGKTIYCVCTVYHDNGHGRCETLVTLAQSDTGDGLTTIQCGHSEDDHHE
jgi:hypothetical protein